VAIRYSIEWETREECLEAFASTYGRRPPKNPPAWWKAFEEWYEEQMKTANAEGIASMEVKTETSRYDDEEEEPDDEDEEEEEHGGGEEDDEDPDDDE
jgi:hypothetical protein